nr:hypothetical protein [uncultured Desulfobacter sp.]
MPIKVGIHSYRSEQVLQNQSFQLVLRTKYNGSPMETQVISRILNLSREIGTPVYRSWVELVDSIEREINRPTPPLVEYPFPTGAIPQYVYRWCSRQAAQQALTSGIVKTGGIHDGIPTLSVQITRKQAETGGGMGIVNAEVHLQINLRLIPQIRDRQPNSINKVSSRSGHPEWKILVTIPANAIQKL